MWSLNCLLSGISHEFKIKPWHRCEVVGFHHSAFSCEFSGKLDDETSQKVLEYERTVAEAKVHKKVRRQSLDIWNTKWMFWECHPVKWGTFPFWQISLSSCWHYYTDWNITQKSISFSQRHPTTTKLLFVFFDTNKNTQKTGLLGTWKKIYQQFRFVWVSLCKRITPYNALDVVKGKLCGFFLGW